MLTHSQKNEAQDPRRLSWLKWALVFAAVLVALITDHFFPGWGRPVVLTLAIFGTIIGFGRPYWGKRFWLTIAASFLLHLLLIRYFRTAVNGIPMPVLFLFAIAEIVAICAAMGWAVSDKEE